MSVPRLEFWWEWLVASPFWPANEEALQIFDPGEVDAEELELPRDLVNELKAAAAWHDSALNWEYPPDPGPWRQEECDHFNVTSRKLFERCQMLLDGRFEITYAHMEEKEDPDLDAYLDAPKSFKRKNP
jgi:hypothetical protein